MANEGLTIEIVVKCEECNLVMTKGNSIGFICSTTYFFRCPKCNKCTSLTV